MIMPKRLLLWSPLLVFGVLCVALWWGLGRDPTRLPSELIGQRLPDLYGQWLSDQRVVKHTDFPTEPWLLHVWASWCASCEAELPTWQRIASQHQVPMYGLNYKDQTVQAQRWVAKYRPPYHDSVADVDGEMGIELGVYGTPETFLIDAHGVIRAKYIGPMAWSKWQQVVWPALLALRGEA